GTNQPLKIIDDGSVPLLQFATDSGKAVFHARPHVNPAEMPDAEFPLVLNTGRVQHQWHTLTKTGKIATLNKLNPGTFVEIHPQDATELGIKNKDKVEIRSRRGYAILPAVVTDRVQPGCCFAPIHWNDVYGDNLCINAVTSDKIDAISQQPELKIAAVALKRVEVFVEAIEPDVTENPAAHHYDYTSPMAFAAVAEETSMTLIKAFSEKIGVAEAVAPIFSEAERTYLGGYISGLQATATLISAVPALPADAPINPTHRTWVNGLLAGMFSRVLPMGVASAAPAQAKPELVLLWASQTGNAEALAEQFAQQLSAQGWAVNFQSMNDYTLEKLVANKLVVFVTSTFGDGDAPDNGGDFWSQLSSESAPELSQLQFALLALGDSNYDQFCGHGKKLFARLQALGARALVERVDCDTDFEVPAAEWFAKLKEQLAPLTSVTKASAANQPSSMTVTTITSATAPAAPSSPATYSKANPYGSRLVINKRLNAPGSGKDVRQFGFDLGTSGITYEAGDALGIWPKNCPEYVFELEQALNLNADAPVVVDTHEKPLHQALLENYEICRPSLEALAFIAQRANSKELKTLLDAEHKKELQDWLYGRQLVDILQEFPIRADIAELIPLLKRLQPRLYSIASSPKAQPTRIDLTVSAVRYTRFRDSKKIRKGVASTFLADRADAVDIPVFVQPSKHFHVPDNGHTPLIMVGPGTGVAPFRGFLQERQARGDRGKNWLFFGEQHAATDFYYQDELLQFQKDGVLNELSLAFSRDQAQKIYVQDRMREQGEAIWNWLEEGAYFCVCGDASRMAKDVDQALRDIIQQYGKFDEAETVNYIRKLNMDKRYLRDVY
ncbi:MAG: reductase, partial [Cellvibrio sp.]|nr:reductase [Cellvibrio sp.]